jgi:sensor histidine kinase regulating citrate/malate metabolism
VKNRIFLKLYVAALLIIVACTLTMAVLLHHAWVGMLRGQIETSLRQKTLMFASRVAEAPPA